MTAEIYTNFVNTIKEAEPKLKLSFYLISPIFAIYMQFGDFCMHKHDELFHEEAPHFLYSTIRRQSVERVKSRRRNITEQADGKFCEKNSSCSHKVCTMCKCVSG